MTLDDVLHPPAEPLRSGRLRVSALHELYWETCGNPQGIPAVFFAWRSRGRHLAHQPAFF